MGKRMKALTGTGARRLMIAAVVLAALIALPALARALSIDVTGEVFSDKCTPCHADINETENPKYVFTHGNHITYQCSTCHPTFPHKPEGTELPVMQECFNCHGLRHGPQGVIATGTCTDCHGDNLPDLRPAFHVAGWSGEGHVAPSLERLNTQCSMCHTEKQCDDCHAAEGVFWSAPEPMIYDAGSGCLACHGSANLIKASALGIKSFQVVEIEASAHRELTCPQCHVDFSYGDAEPETKVWYINAGLSCGQIECHGTDDAETKDNEDIASIYDTSVHGTMIDDGDLTSATCGSCHGGHEIKRLDTEAAKRDLQLAGEEMCMACHQERWDNYDDSYHGAAYKAGAEDAPACWDCHPAHAMLPSDDPASSTNDAKLAATCAGDSVNGLGCHQHKNASEDFIMQSSGMIHGQLDARKTNPLLKLLPWFGNDETSGDGGS